MATVGSELYRSAQTEVETICTLAWCGISEPTPPEKHVLMVDLRNYSDSCVFLLYTKHCVQSKEYE